MRRYRTREGEERLWYEDLEIEQLMQAELARAGLLPSPECPVVEIERFVERHLGATLDQYAALDPDTLGVTEFVVGGPPRVSISRDLTNSALDEDDVLPGLEGRWRATVAHEAAHVVLHRPLYQAQHQNLDLFSTPTDEEQAIRLHRCPKIEVSYRTRQNWDWREVQANKGMAALLMPRELFGELARAQIQSALSAATISPAEAISVARSLAGRFNVSTQAARIRLETLGFIRLTTQVSI